MMNAVFPQKMSRRKPARSLPCLSLNRRQLRLIRPDQRPVRITALRGEVYLTQAGNPGDYILQAGDSFVSHGRGLVVVEALQDSDLILRRLPKA
jgi:hypothetical protein